MAFDRRLIDHYAAGRERITLNLGILEHRRQAQQLVHHIATRTGYVDGPTLKTAPRPLKTVRDVKAALRTQLIALTGTNDLDDCTGDENTSVDFETLAEVSPADSQILHCLHAQSKVKIDSNLCGALHPSVPRIVEPKLLDINPGDSLWAPISFALMDKGLAVTDYTLSSSILALQSIKLRLCFAIEVQSTGCWAIVSESCKGKGPSRKPEDMKMCYARFQNTEGLPTVSVAGLPPIQIDGEVVDGGCTYLTLVWIPFTESVSKGDQKLSPAGIMQATAYIRAQTLATLAKAEAIVSPTLAKTIKAEAKGYLDHDLLLDRLETEKATPHQRVDGGRYVPRTNYVRHIYAGSSLVADVETTPHLFASSTARSANHNERPATPAFSFGFELPVASALSEADSSSGTRKQRKPIDKIDMLVVQRLFAPFATLVVAERPVAPVPSRKALPATDHVNGGDKAGAAKLSATLPADHDLLRTGRQRGAQQSTHGRDSSKLPPLPGDFQPRPPSKISTKNANIQHGETTMTGDLKVTGVGRKPRIAPDELQQSSNEAAEEPASKRQKVTKSREA